MIRRISTKWVLTVLAAVMLPFLGFAWFVDHEMAVRHHETVSYYLLTKAFDIARRLDREVHERQMDIEIWTKAPMTQWTIGDYGGQEMGFRGTLQGSFNRFIESSTVYDVILAINAKGELVVWNTIDAHGNELPKSTQALFDRDFSREPWFQAALKGEDAFVDHHISPLLPERVPASPVHPANYEIGFAVPVRSQPDPQKIDGVVFALMNWSHIEAMLREEPPLSVPSELPNIYGSSYVWLWGPDANTILSHPKQELDGKKVSEPPVDLPELVAAARAEDWGMYPEYQFLGVWKNAAFKHCAGPDKSGFGWVVGVGIDNADIYATVRALRIVLWTATGLVLIVVVIGTVLIARRTTRPIVELKAQTQRIAAGDFEARIEVHSNDELGDLGRAFNDMTMQLSDSRTKLIKAEKDAAWREMARQIAHEIKNPLTPIRLSANLLKRARDEKSPEFDAIFDRTIDLIQRQVENMRKIAADFSAFAGAHKPAPDVFELESLVDEVLAMNAAWAQELGVQIGWKGRPGSVFVDKGELRRVLINLVSNALEAMPNGGRLDVTLERSETGGARVLVLELADTGAGLSDTVRARLFEPYFTTRTHGTGLGLAVARRLVEEMNGTISLEPRAAGQGKGTVARVVLPEHGADAVASDDARSASGDGA